MQTTIRFLRFFLFYVIFCTLSGCYRPPFNQYQPYNNTINAMGVGAGVGAAAGWIAGSPALGAGVGAAALATRSLYRETQPHVIRDLAHHDIQVEKYGNTLTVIVPTDRYFLFNTPRLNELCYPGLMLIIKLIKFYPNRPIYIGGFTDNVGSRSHKKALSQAQAEAMSGFLWANGVPAKFLTVQGYGDKHSVSNNQIIHGSAQNRRLEIQWLTAPPRAPKSPLPYLGPTK